jgi:HEAT repeat protein
VVRLLGQLGEPRALPTLRPLLDSESRELALAAVEAIGLITAGLMALAFMGFSGLVKS